jgi:hypothetical protein
VFVAPPIDDGKCYEIQVCPSIDQLGGGGLASPLSDASI